ncbi:MAG: NAD(P)/FAD-dependent oxidoreductase [Pseudomonadota bacterium]
MADYEINYDTIIVGGGHNGLVCACYLARAGQRVLVLEATDALGGLASSREFHPGFKAAVAHSLQHFPEEILNELRLSEHGFSGIGAELPTVGLDAEGAHVIVKSNSVSGVSQEDINQYAAYRRLLEKCAKALKPSWLKMMPRVGAKSLKELLTFAQVGIKLRLLGTDDMREFFRIASLPSRDLMDERFESELLKATLCWDALVGSTQAPRSPNNTVLTVLYRMIGKHEGGHSLPAGNVESLISALVAAAERAGAEVRTGSPVKQVIVSGDENGQRTEGVELASGETISATRVVSSADPKNSFFKLIGARHLEIGFSNRVNRLRSKGYVAKLHLALSGLPAFTGVDNAASRMIIAPSMDAMEFAWDDAKYGRCPEQPVMECLIPSATCSGMAPAGQHVLSANVMYIPPEIEGGWTDAARAALTDKLLELLESYAPGIREQVLHAELLTPQDLENTFHLSGGHWHHGEIAMDQMLMMRPTYEAAQYATPVPGFFLCGAGTHPGGGLVGAAGRNAAQAILQ